VTRTPSQVPIAQNRQPESSFLFENNKFPVNCLVKQLLGLISPQWQQQQHQQHQEQQQQQQPGAQHHDTS
jgi:hypothetical protein